MDYYSKCHWVEVNALVIVVSVEASALHFHQVNVDYLCESDTVIHTFHAILTDLLQHPLPLAFFHRGPILFCYPPHPASLPRRSYLMPNTTVAPGLSEGPPIPFATFCFRNKHMTNLGQQDLRGKYVRGSGDCFLTTKRKL